MRTAHLERADVPVAVVSVHARAVDGVEVLDDGRFDPTHGSFQDLGGFHHRGDGQQIGGIRKMGTHVPQHDQGVWQGFASYAASALRPDRQV